jgi:hypothetical protein
VLVRSSGKPNFALAIADESLLFLAFFHAPVAQLDRASDYGSEGLGFDSLRVRHFEAGRCTTPTGFFGEPGVNADP